MADATCARESAGDFGNRGGRLPSIAQYLRDLIGKDRGCVDEWGTRMRMAVTWGTCPMTGACQPDYWPWSAAQSFSVTGMVPGIDYL